MDISQNIDREKDTTKPGVVGCLIPKGQAYLTREGRPVLGIECLIMQGLPGRQLILSRESQKDLQDLAGNAMSSTVVGAAIMSALICGFKIVKPDDPSINFTTREQRKKPVLCEVRNLNSSVAKLTAYSEISAEDFMVAAGQSVRLCEGCEKHGIITNNQLYRCVDCSYTACTKCDTAGQHNYMPLYQTRLSPFEFESIVKRSLPMRMKAPHLPEEDLQIIFEHIDNSLAVKHNHLEHLKHIINTDLRFSSIERTEVWTIHYESKYAFLDLVVDGSSVEWRLFAKPDNKETMDSLVRQAFRLPILRMSPTGGDVVQGNWQVWKYSPRTFRLKIKPTGEPIPSFKKDMGLFGFEKEYVWDRYDLSCDGVTEGELGLQVTGQYHLRKCGFAAEGSLHVQENGQLFLFKDVGHYTLPTENTFVISDNYRRLNNGEVRSRTISLPESWQPPLVLPNKDAPEYSEFTDVRMEGKWHSVPNHIQLGLEGCVECEVSVAVNGIEENIILTGSCQQHHLVVDIKAELPQNEIFQWAGIHDVEVVETHRSEFFDDFASLVETTCTVPQLHEWTPFENNLNDRCADCAPQIPAVKWVIKADTKDQLEKDQYLPYEDPRDTPVFERKFKNRPDPFSIHVEQLPGRLTNLRLAINPVTLVHRAAAKLVDIHGHNYHDLELSWCLDTNYSYLSLPEFPAFKLEHNGQNPEASQPSGFIEGKFLRKEQLRSLSWMIDQENLCEPFTEEEIEEALIPRIGWRAQGRAIKKVYQRGGVLADDVGYGKTVIILALIDRQRAQDKKHTSIVSHIPLKATLILVPDHLVVQWQQQAGIFLKGMKVIAISDIKQLEALTISEIQTANIIVAPWKLLEDKVYKQRLAHLAGVLDPPDTIKAENARAGGLWYKATLKKLAEIIEYSRQDSCGLQKKINNRLEAAIQEAFKYADGIVTPSIRLKGQGYQDGKNAKAKLWEVATESKGPKEKLIRDAFNEVLTKRVDLFGLGRLAKGKGMASMRCPLFEIFEFARIVVDEFAYANIMTSLSISSLKTRARWILSATPKLENFADIKKMATLMGINLGVDDISPGFLRNDNILDIRMKQAGK